MVDTNNNKTSFNQQFSKALLIQSSNILTNFIENNLCEGSSSSSIHDSLLINSMKYYIEPETREEFFNFYLRSKMQGIIASNHRNQALSDTENNSLNHISKQRTYDNNNQFNKQRSTNDEDHHVISLNNLDKDKISKDDFETKGINEKEHASSNGEIQGGVAMVPSQKSLGKKGTIQSADGNIDQTVDGKLSEVNENSNRVLNKAKTRSNEHNKDNNNGVSVRNTEFDTPKRHEQNLNFNDNLSKIDESMHNGGNSGRSDGNNGSNSGGNGNDNNNNNMSLKSNTQTVSESIPQIDNEKLSTANENTKDVVVLPNQEQQQQPLSSINNPTSDKTQECFHQDSNPPNDSTISHDTLINDQAKHSQSDKTDNTPRNLESIDFNKKSVTPRILLDLVSTINHDDDKNNLHMSKYDSKEEVVYKLGLSVNKDLVTITNSDDKFLFKTKETRDNEHSENNEPHIKVDSTPNTIFLSFNTNGIMNSKDIEGFEHAINTKSIEQPDTNKDSEGLGANGSIMKKNSSSQQDNTIPKLDLSLDKSLNHTNFNNSKDKSTSRKQFSQNYPTKDEIQEDISKSYVIRSDIIIDPIISTISIDKNKNSSASDNRYVISHDEKIKSKSGQFNKLNTKERTKTILSNKKNLKPFIRDDVIHNSNKTSIQISQSENKKSHNSRKNTRDHDESSPKKFSTSKEGKNIKYKTIDNFQSAESKKHNRAPSKLTSLDSIGIDANYRLDTFGNLNDDTLQTPIGKTIRNNSKFSRQKLTVMDNQTINNSNNTHYHNQKSNEKSSFGLYSPAFADNTSTIQPTSPENLLFGRPKFINDVKKNDKIELFQTISYMNSSTTHPSTRSTYRYKKISTPQVLDKTQKPNTPRRKELELKTIIDSDKPQNSLANISINKNKATITQSILTPTMDQMKKNSGNKLQDGIEYGINGSITGSIVRPKTTALTEKPKIIQITPSTSKSNGNALMSKTQNQFMPKIAGLDNNTEDIISRFYPQIPKINNFNIKNSRQDIIWGQNDFKLEEKLKQGKKSKGMVLLTTPGVLGVGTTITTIDQPNNPNDFFENHRQSILHTYGRSLIPNENQNQLNGGSSVSSNPYDMVWTKSVLKNHYDIQLDIQNDNSGHKWKIRKIKNFKKRLRSPSKNCHNEGISIPASQSNNGISQRNLYNNNNANNGNEDMLMLNEDVFHRYNEYDFLLKWPYSSSYGNKNYYANEQNQLMDSNKTIDLLSKLNLQDESIDQKDDDKPYEFTKDKDKDKSKGRNLSTSQKYNNNKKTQEQVQMLLILELKKEINVRKSINYSVCVCCYYCLLFHFLPPLSTTWYMIYCIILYHIKLDYDRADWIRLTKHIILVDL